MCASHHLVYNPRIESKGRLRDRLRNRIRDLNPCAAGDARRTVPKRHTVAPESRSHVRAGKLYNAGVGQRLRRRSIFGCAAGGWWWRPASARREPWRRRFIAPAAPRDWPRGPRPTFTIGAALPAARGKRAASTIGCRSTRSRSSRYGPISSARQSSEAPCSKGRAIDWPLWPWRRMSCSAITPRNS